jgi:hypothetical protein
MTDSFQLFLSIMLFYVFLSYVVGPLVFYYTMGKTLKSAGNGFIVGSLASIALWLFVGSKMVN